MICTLESNALRVEVDPGYGGEISSIVAREAGIELLYQTPWGETARRQRRPGLTFPASASEGAWMARYGGGWQILFPHAGLPATVEGVERAYHGEASVVDWCVTDRTATYVALETTLFTVPVMLKRRIALVDGVLTVTDVVTNTGRQECVFDYVHHPVFGAPFLDEGCVIETGARTYVPDPRAFLGEFTPGEPLAWPKGGRTDGVEMALDHIPGSAAGIARFGSLRDFSSSWAAVRNPRLDVGVRLSWKPEDFAEAWLWLESGRHLQPPFFGRVYALGLEPSITAAAGPERQLLQLPGGQARTFSLRFELLPGAAPIGPPGGDDQDGATT